MILIFNKLFVITAVFILLFVLLLEKYNQKLIVKVSIYCIVSYTFCNSYISYL